MTMSGNHGNRSEEAVPSTSSFQQKPSVGGKTARGSTGEGSEEASDEEQEEPLSSSSDLEDNDELANFRQLWQQELETEPTPEEDGNVVPAKAAKGRHLLSAIQEKARRYFLQGIEHEQNGKMSDAIQFYKRAVQLEPDIEFRTYETSEQKLRDQVVDEREDANGNPIVKSDPEFEDAGDSNSRDESELMAQMQMIFSRNCNVCTPLKEQQMTHFSTLPIEIVLYILRWVVSSDLDLRSLEMCSEVCLGFYICSRDPEIWRLACARVWGEKCGGLADYGSWRQMFIQRPRLNFYGCYISKTSYVRQGENSYQDQFYRPWHSIAYYRYLRFFPEGLVLMLTSPQDPQYSVAQLKQRKTGNSSVLSGRYCMHDDVVMLILRKEDAADKAGTTNRFRRRRMDKNEQNQGGQTLNIHMRIHSRTHKQLAWLKYDITMSHGGQVLTTPLDLPTSRYPPFRFATVKSYTVASKTPLQREAH